jgi:hypothetical protein
MRESSYPMRHSPLLVQSLMLLSCASFLMAADQANAAKVAVPADVISEQAKEANWPDPNQPIVPASDAQAAAAISALLAAPSIKTLIDTDDELVKAVPEFEKKQNVVITINREPLINLLLMPWWQTISIQDHVPRAVFISAPGSPDSVAINSYILSDQDDASRQGGYVGSFAAPDTPERDTLMEGFPSDKFQIGCVNILDDEAASNRVDHLVIIRDGHLIFLNPAQGKELMRPVVRWVHIASPLERKVDVDMDSLPLSEVATRLAAMLGADLVMPIPAKADANQDAEMPLLTIKAHDKTFESIFENISAANHWVFIGGKPSDLSRQGPFVGISLLFEKSLRHSLLQQMAQQNQSLDLTGADILLGALARKVELPVRPILILSKQITATH